MLVSPGGNDVVLGNGYFTFELFHHTDTGTQRKPPLEKKLGK